MPRPKCLCEHTHARHDTRAKADQAAKYEELAAGVYAAVHVLNTAVQRAFDAGLRVDVAVDTVYNGERPDPRPDTAAQVARVICQAKSGRVGRVEVENWRWEAMNDALRVLAAFARTAPGRLPARVRDAADRVAREPPGGE